MENVHNLTVNSHKEAPLTKLPGPRTTLVPGTLELAPDPLRAASVKDWAISKTLSPRPSHQVLEGERSTAPTRVAVRATDATISRVAMVNRKDGARGNEWIGTMGSA